MLQRSITVQYCMLADALVSSEVAQTVCTGMVRVVVIGVEGTHSTSKGQEMKREREGKGNGCLLLSSFSTTSTKYYLYTLLLLVLSPPKSSELTMRII